MDSMPFYTSSVATEVEEILGVEVLCPTSWKMLGGEVLCSAWQKILGAEVLCPAPWKILSAVSCFTKNTWYSMF
jgi:hypothetical protein